MLKTVITGVLISFIFLGKVNASGYAYVDLQTALETVKDGVTARAKLEKEYKDKQRMIQNREDEIKKLTADYQKKQLVMTAEKRAQEEQNIQKKMAEYKDIAQNAQLQMQKREMELTKPIIDNMRSIIGEMADNDKYDLVYEKNQSGIFYAKDPKDITADLIDKYNEKNKGKKDEKKS